MKVNVLNFKANPTVTNKPTTDKPAQTTPNTKKNSTIIASSALTCLALGGMVIVNKTKTQNINKIFNQVEQASSIMNILKESKLSPKNFKQLMYKITSEEKTSEKFIKEVISNPRKSKENVRILNKKIGGDSELMEWALNPGGYQEAYWKHTKKSFAESKTPDDLIKTSPNWTIWKMKEKFGSDFTFGELPKEFGDTNNYRDVFYSALHNGSPHENRGIKFQDHIGGGLSGKCVRRIEAGDKKYILKYQPDTGNVDINDNISMKSDSTFLNAQLERFLNLNEYKQSPKLKFFDNKTNSALYEITEGTKPSPQEVTDIVDINKKLGDLNDLGVYYNDLNQGNFLIKDNTFHFIDSGESSFVDFFKPGVTSYHFTLPNLNGRAITESASAITLSKI